MTAFLDIADASATAAQEKRFSLRWSVGQLSGTAELTFESPVKSSTTELIGRYVRDYRSWNRKERDRALLAERSLLSLGRAIGSSLVDSDYRLLTFCDAIEREGLAALDVSVRSNDPAVLNVPWEALILPDTSHCLAAASSSFVRAPTDIHPFEQPVCELRLNEAQEALRYLRVEVGNATGQRCVSQALRQTSWQQAWTMGVTSDPLHSARDGETWHIVHWSGHVEKRAGELQVSQAASAGPDAALSTRAFAERLRSLGAQLLIIDPATGSSSVDELACELIHHGVENVVTLAHAIELGWPSDWCEQLLDCLGLGLGLRQAVVETRKRMQRSLLEDRQSDPEPPHAAQVWHALRHYSARDVRFFSQPIARVAWESSPGLRELRQRLFGFDSSYLPPDAPDLGHDAPLRLRNILSSNRLALVTAVPGGGLSHALHRLALFTCAVRDVERAYYWDFAREAFDEKDILEMVAGVHGQTDPGQVTEQAVLAPLSEHRRELFVFDNLDSCKSPAQISRLLSLCERVAQSGGWCVVGAHSAIDWPGIAHWQLPPLSELERVALSHTRAPHVLGLGPRVMQLFEQLQGNPLLLDRLLPECKADNLEALLAEATQHFGADRERSQQLQLFYTCRWRALEPHWQLLLRAWLPLETLYLQILMVGIDRADGGLSEPGSELWRLLEAPPDTTCANAISRLQAMGYAEVTKHGTRVDNAAQRFIRSQAEPELPQALLLALTHALCTGLVRVLDRSVQQGHESITGHLFGHRAQLRRAIALAFQLPSCTLATSAFLRFHRLLLQAGAAREATDWASELLTTVGPRLCAQLEPELAMAWLSVALRAHVSPPSAALLDGARSWHARLEDGELQASTPLRATVPLAVALLEKLYDQLNDHAAYRTIARIACDFYGAQGNKSELIAQRIKLAAVEHCIGNFPERDRIEDELLHELDDRERPAALELRSRALTQLARMRLRRQDADGAELIVGLLEREPTASSLQLAACLLRGELALQREQWETAAVYYCQIWAQTMKGVRFESSDIDATANALKLLELRLGPERFASVYEQHAGSMPTPASLGFVRSS